MKKKILLIDDEMALAKLTKLNLERTGAYEVSVAHSGEEGLRMVQQTPFDLVITDFRMPGMNGKQVLDAIKAMKPACPVVLCSIYHDDSRMIHGMKLKADGLISKPMNHEQLHQTIQEALAKAERRATGANGRDHAEDSGR